MATLKDLNEQIKHLNLVCVKSYDYFWFMHGDADDLSATIPQSVYVRRFSDLTMQQWLNEVYSAQS